MYSTVVLITGASSGIGKALALLYAKNGHHLLLTGRDENALQVTADQCRQQNVRVYTFCQDLKNLNAIENLWAFIKKNQCQVDILINNAGFGHYGEFSDMPLESIQPLLKVNISSLVELTRLIIPSMKARKKGQVVNIASVYAYVAVPQQTLYAATKAFVKSFSLGLATELKNSGVNVCCVCPGSTQTQFHRRIGKNAEHSSFTLSATRVAEIIYVKAKKHQQIIIPGWYNRVFVFLSQVVPAIWLPKLIHLLIYRLRKI